MIPKFRAWDKEKELMGEVVQINFEIDTIEYVAFTDLYVWSNTNYERRVVKAW